MLEERRSPVRMKLACTYEARQPGARKTIGEPSCYRAHCTSFYPQRITLIFAEKEHAVSGRWGRAFNSTLNKHKKSFTSKDELREFLREYVEEPDILVANVKHMTTANDLSNLLENKDLLCENVDSYFLPNGTSFIQAR